MTDVFFDPREPIPDEVLNALFVIPQGWEPNWREVATQLHSKSKALERQLSQLIRNDVIPLAQLLDDLRELHAIDQLSTAELQIKMDGSIEVWAGSKFFSGKDWRKCIDDAREYLIARNPADRPDPT